MGRSESDNELEIVSKHDVVKRRLNKTPFTAIIGKMKTESEATTKAFIDSLFKNKQRKIVITRLVISVKDSYSQSKIAVPVRGNECTHLQPFDAKSFLLRPKKYQKCTF